MKAYIIKRCDTNQFYRWRPSLRRWVDDPQKAKLYKRKSDATNAVSLMRSYWHIGVTFKILEYEMQPTGVSWEVAS